MSLRQDVGREPQLGCSSFNFDSSACCRRGINREIYRESRAKSTVRKFRASIMRVYNSREICLQKEWNNTVNRLWIIPKEVFFFVDFTYGLLLFSHMFWAYNWCYLIDELWKKQRLFFITLRKIIPLDIRLKELMPSGNLYKIERSKRCAVCILFFTYLKNTNSQVDQVYW